MTIVKTLGLAGLVSMLLLGSAIILWPRWAGTNPSGPDDSPGQRLLRLSRDRGDYRLYVGLPAAMPTTWAEVARVDERRVTTRDGQSIGLRRVTAYLVAYPGGGLLDTQHPEELPLPEWVQFPSMSGDPDRDTLTFDDLKRGRELVRVDFGESTSHPDSPDHYSTTLTNLSGKRVRVNKFGGYVRDGDVYTLDTITAKFFTSEDFTQWYGLKGEWIEPGQSVRDSNNYGSPPVLWAYFCETDGGQEFITGGVIE